MRKQEIDLFKSLCSFKDDSFNETLLSNATPRVLGYLFYNRMQGIAYGVLERSNCLNKANREFINSLANAYEHNIRRNRDYFDCIKYLHRILKDYSDKYAMLKGAYLCLAYPEGYRTSNDVDLLVRAEDVTEIGDVLKNHGFKQGAIKNGRFVPATRREIIESKMLREETVPYIKNINLPSMKYLEVDINFSLDYKSSEGDILDMMLLNSETVEVHRQQIKTLEINDFIIHLCAHLYKEATTLPWVNFGRDMSMYKYSDIYFLVSQMDQLSIRQLFERASKYGMEKIVAFAIVQTNELLNFKNEEAVLLSNDILESEPDYIHTVFSPEEKSEYIYIWKKI